MDELLKKWRERECHVNKLFTTHGIVGPEAWNLANNKMSYYSFCALVLLSLDKKRYVL